MGYKAYDPNRKKKKKKTGLIVCVVLVCVIAALAGGGAAVYHWQKDNIEALKFAASHSGEEISEQIEENSRKNQERMSEIAGASMRPLTEEESELLSEGEITEDEAIALVTGKATLEEIQSGEYVPEGGQDEAVSERPEEGAADAGSAQAENSGGANTAENGSSGGTESGSSSGSGSAGNSGGDVSAILGKIYLLQSEFTGSVESLISQAKSDAGTMSRNDLMKKYSSLAASMEGSCDSRMESLLGELAAAGESQSVISEIRSSYENEKSLKKAELLSRFSN